jgi:hypothetical protein
VWVILLYCTLAGGVGGWAANETRTNDEGLLMTAGMFVLAASLAPLMPFMALYHFGWQQPRACRAEQAASREEYFEQHGRYPLPPRSPLEPQRTNEPD